MGKRQMRYLPKASCPLDIETSRNSIGAFVLAGALDLGHCLLSGPKAERRRGDQLVAATGRELRDRASCQQRTGTH